MAEAGRWDKRRHSGRERSRSRLRPPSLSSSRSLSLVPPSSSSLPPSLPLSSSHSISIFPLCSPPVSDNRLTPSHHRLSASASVSLSCSLAPFKRCSLSLPLSLSASAASVRLCLRLPLPSAPLLPLPLLLRLRLRASSTSAASLRFCHPLPLCSLLRPFSLSLSASPTLSLYASFHETSVLAPAQEREAKPSSSRPRISVHRSEPVSPISLSLPSPTSALHFPVDRAPSVSTMSLPSLLFSFS